MIKLYNTLTRKKEIFRPLNDKKADLYVCGPTVYFYAHIGNLRTYLFEDILRRTLEYNGYKVKQVMNITDVGHLTSDADQGEDKMIKALKREGKKLNEKSILEIANFYTRAFKEDLKRLNIKEPAVWCKATEHIKEQIGLIKKLFENGYAYETKSAVYFDTSKIKDYGKLAQLDIKGLKEGARARKRTDKKNPTDFALWLKLVGQHKNHIMNWDSPWGKGFPGWHIECSAMSIKHLGEKIDIHCGGIDHIPVHHTNERAQNIGATGHQVVQFWVHGAFLTLKKGRMGKSKQNFVTLQALIDRGFNPLAYRYITLTAHYRSPLEFSWDSLQSAQNALNNLYEKVLEINTQKDIKTQKDTKISSSAFYQKKFKEIINNDLDMPKALSLVWQLVKAKNLSPRTKYKLLLEFDKVLGLNLSKLRKIVIPELVKKLVLKREKLRKEKKWQAADEIRKEVEKLGFEIEDTKTGPKIKKNL